MEAGNSRIASDRFRVCNRQENRCLFVETGPLCRIQPNATECAESSQLCEKIAACCLLTFHQDERRRILSFIRLFLNDSLSFYISLLEFLCSAFNIDSLEDVFDIINPLRPFSQIESNMDIRDANSFPRSRIVELIYRNLICLGDVARYKETLKKTRSWNLTEFIYESAVGLIPSNGNAYNQLAVISAYQGDDDSALVMYLKA